MSQLTRSWARPRNVRNDMLSVTIVRKMVDAVAGSAPTRRSSNGIDVPTMHPIVSAIVIEMAMMAPSCHDGSAGCSKLSRSATTMPTAMPLIAPLRNPTNPSRRMSDRAVYGRT